MNIEEYIASGILEAYVLGLTSAEESREVERMVAAYPEVKAELEDIRLAIESYSNSFEKQPPAEIKAKVMEAIRSESNGAKVIDIRNAGKAHPRFSAYAAAAAIALLIISGIFNYVLYNRLQRANDQMAAMQETNQRTAKEMEVQLAQMEQLKEEMNIMRDPRNKMIRLKGVDNSSASLATIYWNTASKEVYLDVNSLPEPPKGMQYQLWAIVDGKPVDAGMIDMTKPGIHKMKAFDAAQAFAVTLEKEGGSPTPNLSAMYVIGNV